MAIVRDFEEIFLNMHKRLFSKCRLICSRYGLITKIIDIAFTHECRLRICKAIWENSEKE